MQFRDNEKISIKHEHCPFNPALIKPKLWRNLANCQQKFETMVLPHVCAVLKKWSKMTCKNWSRRNCLTKLLSFDVEDYSGTCKQISRTVLYDLKCPFGHALGWLWVRTRSEVWLGPLVRTLEAMRVQNKVSCLLGKPIYKVRLKINTLSDITRFAHHELHILKINFDKKKWNSLVVCFFHKHAYFTFKRGNIKSVVTF